MATAAPDARWHVILRRRGLTPHFVPPISVIFADRTDRYIRGLTDFREGRVAEWVEAFASAQAAALAEGYVGDVSALQDDWRQRLREHSRPRADSAAWSIIDVLPAHPIVSVPAGVAATGRNKPAVTNAVAELEAAGVLRRAGESARNRTWEATGLLDIIASVESGERLRR